MDNREELIKEILNITKHMTVEEAQAALEYIKTHTAEREQ